MLWRLWSMLTSICLIGRKWRTCWTFRVSLFMYVVQKVNVLVLCHYFHLSSTVSLSFQPSDQQYFPISFFLISYVICIRIFSFVSWEVDECGGMVDLRRGWMWWDGWLPFTLLGTSLPKGPLHVEHIFDGAMLLIFLILLEVPRCAVQFSDHSLFC